MREDEYEYPPGFPQGILKQRWDGMGRRDRERSPAQHGRSKEAVKRSVESHLQSPSDEEGKESLRQGIPLQRKRGDEALVYVIRYEEEKGTSEEEFKKMDGKEEK